VAVKEEGTGCGEWNKLANLLRSAVKCRADETANGKTVSARA
jgi:hypothetical protein